MPASTGDPATNGSGPGPHIGAEDIATPPWAEGYESASKVGALAMTRAAPRLVAQAARWSWQASPRLTLLSVLVQLAAGLVTAFGLLATADVFTRLLAQGPTPERVVAALPALPLVVAAAATRGLLDAAIAALSGALVQWQRLSVARGLYRDAPVVIADEPTAALDARAEQAVFATLHGRTGAGAERITVLVTHRLANVRFADQILVLERGRIIERGRHDELMALRGTYFELFTLQARAYGGTEPEVGGDTVGP